MFKDAARLSMFCIAALDKVDLPNSNNKPESNFTIIPSPAGITSAPGIVLSNSAACLSMFLPMYAPAVPPIAPPITAPTAVFPAFLPIKAPIAPPATAPIPAPFCVLVIVLHAGKITDEPTKATKPKATVLI